MGREQRSPDLLTCLCVGDGKEERCVRKGE